LEETKLERTDASLYAKPRFLDEDAAVVATAADEVVLVVVGFGVGEALVERVVGVTTGAIEVVGTTIGVVEVVGTATGVVEVVEALWVAGVS
jgi:hypothetical protein